MSDREQAFSLVELTLAIGVAAFCLLAVFGLLPVAQSSHQTASEQTVANGLTSEIISDLRATHKTAPPTPQVSPRFGLAVGAPGAPSSAETLFFRDGADVIGPPDTPAVGADPLPRYRATVVLTPPASGRRATTGRILVTWPAMADPVPGSAPTKYNGSLETFVALDRN
jgi:type II secretory pathway pseudopilin PulG